MIPTTVPAEFRVLARNVNPSSLSDAKSMDDLVMFALIGIDHHAAAVLRPFVADLLLATQEPGELVEFWATMPSGLYFRQDADARRFLNQLLIKISEQPYVHGPDQNQ